jgi:hypothetical protein
MTDGDDQTFYMDYDRDGVADAMFTMGPADSPMFVGNFANSDSETVAVLRDTGVDTGDGNLQKFSYYDMGTGTVMDAGNGGTTGSSDLGVVGDWTDSGFTDIGIKHPFNYGASSVGAQYRTTDGSGTYDEAYAFYDFDDMTVVGTWTAGEGESIAINKNINGDTEVRWNFQDNPMGGFTFGDATTDGQGGAGHFNPAQNGSSDIYVIRIKDELENAKWVMLYNTDFGPAAVESAAMEFGPKTGFTPLVCDYDGDGLDDLGYAVEADGNLEFHWKSPLSEETGSATFGPAGATPFAGMWQ